VRARDGGFSLLELVVSLTLLGGIVLTTMLVSLTLPRASAPDRLQRATNLARSVMEEHRALPLSAPEWQVGSRVEDDRDPELSVRVEVSEPASGQRLLSVAVGLKRQSHHLVRLELLRTEGGL
jgi:type II secretory pathway pseudopilin PulG